VSVTIKATCPTCGEVTMTNDAVQLVICNLPPLSHYSFACPSCSVKVEKPADPYVISLLVYGGVKPQAWHVPSEFSEPKHGDPLDRDDLLDFALAMAAAPDALVAHLAAEVQR
jgi:hypothetical protein